MATTIKAQIDKISLGSGDSIKVRWTRDTGELAYGPNYPERTKWRDEWAILIRNQDPRDGLRIYLRPGSKVKIRFMSEKNQPNGIKRLKSRAPAADKRSITERKTT
jgi:ABC-type phosphonate transport system ATPase subunit